MIGKEHSYGIFDHVGCRTRRYKDPGAVYKGRQEKDDNLRLVLAIGEILSDRGLDVRYTRTTDVYETPYEKAMKANNAGVDLFISIHRNSFPADNEVEGVEV